MPGTPPTAFSPAGLPSRPRSKSIRTSNAPVTIHATSVAISASRVRLETSLRPRVVHLSLETILEDSTPVALADIPFNMSVAGNGEFVLSSKEQQTPWKFSIRISSELKQMTISFTLDFAGLNVDQALKAVTFYDALAGGGTLQIKGRHPLTDGDLPIASGSMPAGAVSPPDIGLVETLERLAFIEKKTGASFSIPPNDIPYEVTTTIAATARILETGHAKYEAQPWISVSPFEQAKSALEIFASGNPAPIAIHFTGQAVVILGTHVMLGPVTLFCDRAYIAANDLEDLRQQLSNAKDEDSFNIKFTPFENCPIEARYVNWLPDEEAEAIRQLPMYRKDDVTANEQSWTVLNTDIAKAVSLLESWYDEDAEEQNASWKLIKASLERDRLSHRKLFP
jgi:hypothetical protein